MICTKGVYDELLNFYYKNKDTLESLNRADRFLRCLFLLKNIEWDKGLITSIQVRVEYRICKDIMDFINFSDVFYESGEIVLDCIISHENRDENLYLYLHELPHYNGYCDCTPDMGGYYEEHGCCGKGCDYHEPTLTLYYDGFGYTVQGYMEYMYFDFLREIHGQEDLINNRNRAELLNHISNLERELEIAKKELKEIIDKIK